MYQFLIFKPGNRDIWLQQLIHKKAVNLENVTEYVCKTKSQRAFIWKVICY